MDHAEGPDRQPEITEDDVQAEDVERRDFLRIGVFAATGLVGLTLVGCDSSDSADTDSGDPADADPDDPADADRGDPADSD